jgi:hypothetical protein
VLLRYCERGKGAELVEVVAAAAAMIEAAAAMMAAAARMAVAAATQNPATILVLEVTTDGSPPCALRMWADLTC